MSSSWWRVFTQKPAPVRLYSAADSFLSSQAPMGGRGATDLRAWRECRIQWGRIRL
jgi:hypothetical protein